MSIASKVAFALQNITASLEALDGVKAVEIEKVFYCRLTDFSELTKASSSELQEQWEIRPKETGNGSVRVRAVNNETFVLTTKVFNTNGEGKIETEIEVTKDIFEAFKSISPIGMYKRRFCFPVPDTDYKWEVDVYFKDKEEQIFQEWVKVDFECESLDTELPPFPLSVSKVISGNRDILTDEEKQQLDELFSTVFIEKNALLKEAE